MTGSTKRWENRPVDVAPLKSSGAEFISTLVGLQKTLGTVDPRDAAIEDLRNQLADERERADRAESRSRHLEGLLQQIREAIR